MNNPDMVNAVQKMQNFIKDHIREQITLNQLSKAAGYSQWHSARIFKELTGKTPFDYIRSYRLSEAAKILRDTKTKVIDVAFDFVFDSHEGFTKAFSKEFGLPPKLYSRQSPAIPLFIPYDIRDYFLTLGKGEKIMKRETDTVFVQVIERPERKLLLKRGIKATEYFGFCEEVGCDVWGLLTSIKEALYEPVGLWLPDHLIKEGTSKYVQGVELPLDYNKPIPSGYEIIDLPPCKMMVFQSEPYDDADFMEKIINMSELIDNYKPEIFGFEFADETAPRFQLAPMGYRGYIEARPVKLLNK